MEGIILPTDMPALILMPWTWGAITGLTLVAWAYEQVAIRRWGERIIMLLVLVYLVVGVLAAEKLADWLADLPPEWGELVLDCCKAYNYSPFTVLRDVLREPPARMLSPISCW